MISKDGVAVMQKPAPEKKLKLQKLALGTVQLGLDYGRVNKSGQPSRFDAVNIIKKAVSSGVEVIDTARAYGDSEAVIGEALGGNFGNVFVTTKLSPLDNLPENVSAKDVEREVLSSVNLSLDNLKTKRIDVLMLHRWQHRTAFNGAIWRTLLSLQKEGVIDKIGVSVSSPDEACEALSDVNVKYVQLPFNLLDSRWNFDRVRTAVDVRPDVEIQARSVLLQGILASPSDCWPKISDVDSEAIVKKLDEMVQEFGRTSRADLCYAYVRAMPWISSVVVGMETLAQLDENIELFSLAALTASQCEIVRENFCDIPEELLNPAKW